MAAQSLAYNDHIFILTLRMEFVAHMTTTALTGELINKMRGFRDRPLVRVNLYTADITCLGLRHPHLLLRTWRMLLLWKMFLAEAVMAVGTATESLFATLVATARGMYRRRKTLGFSCILHVLGVPLFRFNVGAIIHYAPRSHPTSFQELRNVPDDCGRGSNATRV